MKVEQESICINCLYGSQPLGYYPIVCCFSDIKELRYDKKQCKNYKKANNERPKIDVPQIPWQITYGWLSDNN